MQRILNFFRRRTSSASIAKERLQIIVSHESSRAARDPEFIRKLQEEILAVISKYVHVDQEKIRVQLERTGDHSVLELNVTLPDATELQFFEKKALKKEALEEVL